MMRLTVFAVALAIFIVAPASAQIPYIGGTTLTENFNTLASPPPALNPWTNNVTLPGWYAADGGGAVTQYHANNGSSASGNLYSYGADGDPDRALGSAASNATGAIYFGVALQNAHPTWVLTSFTASYFMEQWRDASEDDWFTFFEYRMNATGIDDPGAWTPVPAGDLWSILSDNSGALNGNVVNAPITVTVNGLNWLPGDTLWLRWRDPNDPGSDHGLAIDDFSFSAVPEPTTMALVGLGMGAAGLVTRRLRRKKAEPAVAG